MPTKPTERAEPAGPKNLSRRAFLSGVLVTGTAAAAGTYFVRGGQATPKITLRFVTGADPTGLRDLLVAMWVQANPDTGIYVDEVSGPTQDQRDGMLRRAQAKSADVFGLDVINIPFFQAKGLIRALDLPQVNFLKRPLIPCRLGNPDEDADYYAVPYSAEVGMIFVRGAPASDALSPDTPTLAEAVSALQAQSHGFAGQLKSSGSSTAEAFTVNILEWALMGDPNIIDEYGRPVEQLEAWQQALLPLQSATSSGRLQSCDGEDDTKDTFRTKSLTYMRNWPVKYRELQQDKDPGALGAGVQVGPLPLGILGGQSLAISSTNQDSARCQAFIEFLTSEPAQKLAASYGSASTIAPPYDDKNLQASIPHLTRLRGAIEASRLRPMKENYLTFSSVLSNNVAALLQNGQVLGTPFINQLLSAIR